REAQRRGAQAGKGSRQELISHSAERWLLLPSPINRRRNLELPPLDADGALGPADLSRDLGIREFTKLDTFSIEPASIEHRSHPIETNPLVLGPAGRPIVVCRLKLLACRSAPVYLRSRDSWTSRRRLICVPGGEFLAQVVRRRNPPSGTLP